MLVVQSSPFGNASRTRVLLALHLLGESYPRELARLLGIYLNSAQTALRSLERDGLVAVRPAGRTRLARLNPRYFALAELGRYVARLAEADRSLASAVVALRRRARQPARRLLFKPLARRPGARKRFLDKRD